MHQHLTKMSGLVSISGIHLIWLQVDMRSYCMSFLLLFNMVSFSVSDAPFGQLPVLEVDGTKISNTLPIARFLARQYGLLPKDSLEQAKADMLAEEIRNLSDKLRPVTQAAFFFNDFERKVTFITRHTVGMKHLDHLCFRKQNGANTEQPN